MANETTLQQDTSAAFGPFDRVWIVLPSLNPDAKMTNTVRGLLEAGFSRVLIVDDGSAPEFRAPFEEAAALPGVTVIKHDVNRGKGVALKTAFRWLIDNAPDVKGCVTVDGDGQHAPEDTAACARKMLETGRIVFGCRDFDDPAVPSRNRFGNKVTRLVFRLLIGMTISDAQTGLRAFPRDRFEWLLGIGGERYEYESNMLLEMQEESVPFEEVTIRTIYIDDNASSHFHVFRDSFRIYKPILGRAKAAKFFASSAGCAVIDIGVFALLNGLMRLWGFVGEDRLFAVGNGAGVTTDWTRIAIATVVARVISSLFNYHWNRNAVFRSTEKKSRTIVRYYILAVCLILIDAKLVTLLSGWLHASGFGEACLKVLVDLALFFGSYQIQKRWVFRKEA
jgi:glycosyltransferase involved in cell wall biosynthesis